ncbi:Uncharacterized protein Rs2_21120 [Raphanus sativus]|nr:Uncharacterized protein Rs2_21120 [Raphanus sativus]
MERFGFSPSDLSGLQRRGVEQWVSSRLNSVVVLCCSSVCACSVWWWWILRVSLGRSDSGTLSPQPGVLRSSIGVGGESESGCNRGESVCLDSLCVCFWFLFEWSSMAVRRFLAAPQLLQSFHSSVLFCFSEIVTTVSFDESSLLFSIVVFQSLLGD